MTRYRNDPNAPSHLRRLVESAREDGLDADRRRRVAERLGIAPSAEGPPKVDTVKSSKSWLSFGTASLTAIVLLGGSAVYVGSKSSPPPSTSITSPGVPTTDSVPSVTPASAGRSVAGLPPAAVAEVATAAAAAVASIDITALPDVRPSSASKPLRAPAPADVAPNVEPGASDLHLEIIALDEVRRAMDAESPREALARLDEYTSRFPEGKLREEATVLRIEALHASGDQAAAESLARRLFRQSPNTPYAARVRAALVSPSRE